MWLKCVKVSSKLENEWFMYTYIHTYIYIYIYAYMYTYIYVYIYMNNNNIQNSSNVIKMCQGIFEVWKWMIYV